MNENHVMTEAEAKAQLLRGLLRLRRVSRMLLIRLDLEARLEGEHAVFLGNGLRSELREALAGVAGAA